MAETTLYNPASLREEELISSFVVRTKTFDRIFKDIKGSDMRYPEKHYLIQGQRGMGKTTLLLRLKYEVERTESLRDWLIPVFFSEETYDVNSLSSLWEKLLKFLDDHFDTGGEFYDYTEKYVDEDDYERLCFNFLIETLHERGKKLILFYDNFGELFLDNLKEKEKRRLREILIDCNEIRIIGASAVVINDLHDYSQPFFEFFQIIHLDGLSKEETYNLIAKLQEDCPQDRRIELKKHKAKIETLAVLTGGVIRTIMMLYQVLLDDPNGKALEDLEKVLDKVTPLYKHRIEDLPLQQRRIVDVIAKKWDAVSAKDIAAEIREDGKKMQTKLVSAQLAQLEKNNVVEKKATTTKNNFYQLKERFFNIWYLMRNGDRRDKKRVAWLTKFLEMWYDDDDSFDAFIRNHIDSLRSGKYVSASALLVAEALVNSDKFDPTKLDPLIEETSKVLKEDEQKYLPNLENRKLALAIRYSNDNNLEKAIQILSNVKREESYLLTAKYYLDLSLTEKAKLTLDKVSDISSNNLNFLFVLCDVLKAYEILFRVIDASSELKQVTKDKVIGDAYFNQKIWDKALNHYNSALANGLYDVLEKIKASYEFIGDLEKAEEALLEGVEREVISREELYSFYLQKKQDYVSLEKALKGAPKDESFYFYRGVLKMNKADLEGMKEDSFKNAIPDFEKSMELSIMANSSSSSSSMSAFFFLLLYQVNLNKNLNYSKKLLEDIKGVDIIESFPPFRQLKAFVLVWSGAYQDNFITQVFNEVVDSSEDIYKVYELFNDLLMLLLAKHQYHFLLNQFEKNRKLKESFKPVYYALMSLMEDEMPNEIIKMGEELRGPVEEILQKVNQMKVDYK